VNGEHKITGGHRARTALVYLRQSTLMQVREHTESTLRQYALAGTAIALGWAPRDVEVIDRDLGLSGTSAAHRQGFRELMSRVCLGEVGAVFGLEISRLGRSNADLARLAEMARLTGTLLIDSDGVYDLSDFNDWLVLGLKSTMSQALCRYPDKLSYADIAVMPTRQREYLAGRGDGQNVRHNHSASRNASMSSAGW
jgi:hypothetical protein